MKLITWNIQWGRGADGRVDLDRIISHARRCADFDVLCLQEVSAGFAELPGADASDQFAALAAHLPGFHAFAGIGTDLPDGKGGRCRFGNMILSRYPVAQVFAHLLPWPVEQGVMSMQRVALEANIASPLGMLRITTTHLEYYSAAQRRLQIERLRELQRDGYAQAQVEPVGKISDGPFCCPGRGIPAILTGDCNFRPESDDYAQLISPIDAVTPPYLDAWKVVHGDLERPPTVGVYDKRQWPGVPFCFDFIFVSEDLAPQTRAMRVDMETDASDHQPLLLELGTSAI